jgi:rubredoxin
MACSCEVSNSLTSPSSKLLPLCKIPLMKREMVWIGQLRFRGWGCSECAWVFNPEGAPTGETFDAMMQNFESNRDKGICFACLR